MRVVCLTDLHGEERSLRAILEQAGQSDVLLLGGDLTNFGTPNQAEHFIRVAQEYSPCVLAVAGNCDSAAIDLRLAALGVSLFSRGVLQAGVAFFGVSAMPPWHGHMYELTESEIAVALESGAQQVGAAAIRVVLSHAPPRDCRLDQTRRGHHVGSTALRTFIDQQQPTLVFCGHIHEARGIDRLGATTIVNCGTAYEGHYALAEIGEEFEVSLRAAQL